VTSVVEWSGVEWSGVKCRWVKFIEKLSDNVNEVKFREVE
jgi:hypothetical protein